MKGNARAQVFVFFFQHCCRAALPWRQAGFFRDSEVPWQPLNAPAPQFPRKPLNLGLCSGLENAFSNLKEGFCGSPNCNLLLQLKKCVFYNPQCVYTSTSYSYLLKKNSALVAHGFGTACRISRLTNLSTTHSASV